MPTSGITIQNLVESLTKAGVPLDAARPQIESAVRGGGQDPEYQQKIQKLQEMDAKLRGVYSDPSSKLFLENPMERERAVTGATNIESRAIRDDARRRERAQDDQITQAVSYFKQLDSLAKKEAKTAGTKAKSTKEIENLRKKTGIELAEKVGIKDPKAQDIFLNLPEAFQEEWLRYSIRGKEVPKQGYSAKEVQDNYNTWKKERDASRKGASTTTSSSSSVLDRASASSPTSSTAVRRAPEPSLLDKIRRSVISLPIPYR